MSAYDDWKLATPPECELAGEPAPGRPGARCYRAPAEPRWWPARAEPEDPGPDDIDFLIPPR